MKWISKYEKGLPNFGELVLVNFEDESGGPIGIVTAFLGSNSHWSICSLNQTWTLAREYQPTHWMRIPEILKDEE